MTIYDSLGVVVYDAPINTSAIIKRELMGDYYIEMTFDVADRINVGRGCYTIYNNNKFEILSNVTPEYQGVGYRYTLRFEAQQSQMKRCKVFWREGDAIETTFHLTTDIASFGELVVSNVNAFLGGNNWSVGGVPSDIAEQTHEL